MAKYTDLVGEAKRLLKRSEADQWRLAELTHEVVDGGKNRRQWAEDIGVSEVHSRRLYGVWERWGTSGRTHRPSFPDAYATVKVGADEIITSSQERDRRIPKAPEDRIKMARTLLTDKEVAAAVIKDATARSIVGTAIEKHHRESPPRPAPQRKQDPTLEMIQAMLDMDRSMQRLIENANDARRQGFLPPKNLHEFAEKMRLYADAIESIANSRGLTDDALAEWIGEGA